MVFASTVLEDGGLNLRDGCFKTCKHKNLSAWRHTTSEILLFVFNSKEIYTEIFYGGTSVTELL